MPRGHVWALTGLFLCKDGRSSKLLFAISLCKLATEYVASALLYGIGLRRLLFYEDHAGGIGPAMDTSVNGSGDYIFGNLR